MFYPVFRENRRPLVAPAAIECHPADLTATISAEMPLRIAQWRLAEFDQWIPIDGNPNLPIGTLVEQNSSGPLRLGYGAWRDLLLGCQFRIGNGELITAGGRTMKNVAGYDLTKFMVGQRGIFGKIETITLRTYRQPAVALLARFAASDAMVGRWITTPLRPRWAAMTSQSLFCGWLDEEPAIDLFERLLSDQKPLEVVRRSLTDDIAHRAELWPGGENLFRASVPPTKILAFAQTTGIAHWTADAAFGIVVGKLDGVDEPRLQAAADRLGGSVTIFHANEPAVWNASAEQLAILDRLKKAME